MKKINANQAAFILVDKIINHLTDIYLYDEDIQQLPSRIQKKLEEYLKGGQRYEITEKYFSRIFAEEFGDELDDDLIEDCKVIFQDDWDAIWVYLDKNVSSNKTLRAI